jgi:membrane protein/epoxyqueuosine reductase
VLANAISFNILLCLFPLLLVLGAVAQQLPLGSRAASALHALLEELIPFGHQALSQSLKGLAKTARGLEFFSLVLIVWGSSGIFMPVEMALNRVWGGRGPRSFLVSRVLAFLMTVAGGVIALASVALTSAARAYSRDWPRLAGLSAKGSAVLLTVLLFFLVYRLVPDANVSSRVALKAALWAGGAWEGAKYLFLIQLNRMNLQAFYGPLAFAVSLVLWSYVSSLTLVFGALMSPAAASGRAGPAGRGRPKKGASTR